MAALDHPWNDIVAPFTDGDLEHVEDLCRCEIGAAGRRRFAVSLALSGI